MAIIIVTHDLGVIAQMCDQVIVMYAGKICEKGSIDDIFYNPCHEYTKGLLKSIPYGSKRDGKLIPISGTPVDLLNMPQGCSFVSRCPNSLKLCLRKYPQEKCVGEGHYSTCWLNMIDELKEAINEGGGEDE